MKYEFNTIDVDPGPSWYGYNLHGQNGIDFNVVNGVGFKNKLFAGIGIGYLNFEGINGFSLFSDFEYLPLQTRLSPLINFKLGYSHILNQYENGTETALAEICVGLNFAMTEKMGFYVKAGHTLTQ